MITAISEATIEKLQMTFATRGLSTTVLSDNATSLATSEFEAFMARNNI